MEQPFDCRDFLKTAGVGAASAYEVSTLVFSRWLA